MGTTWNNTLKEFRPLIVITVALMLITTVVYPLVVTGVGQLFFNDKANGSVIALNGVDVGSSLIGQAFTGDQYFQGRPSAAGAGYDASASSGSNLGPTSDKFINGVKDDPTTADVDESFDGIVQRVAAFREANGLSADQVIPSDAVTASASGLDPDISPATARLEVNRVAKARGANASDIQKLVDDNTSGRILGFIGEPRVNVLQLNIDLDKRFPAPAK